MDRREAVSYISLLLGGTILGAEAFLTGCNTGSESNATFSQKKIDLLNEIGDTILPPTKTPGAKAANVGEFMKVMINDCYEGKDQKIFHEGIVQFEQRCKKENGDKFTDLKSEQRHAFLVKLDNEQKEFMKTWKTPEPKPYFRMIKELTLLGYFTSEIGCTQARRYSETPGKFEACIPYKKGDKAWA